MDIGKMKNSIIETFYSLIDERLNIFQKKLTIIRKGKIVSSDGNDIYTISINNANYKARSHYDYKINDIVWVVVANGNYKDLFILY